MPKLLLSATILTLTALLTACGSSTTTTTKQQEKPTGALPTVGATVGNGQGYGIVTVTPSADEIETLQLINELRTKGTLNGKATERVGTCMETWTALPPLDYSGVLALAARNHAKYLAFSPAQWDSFNPDGHKEVAGTANFTGETTDTRIAYAATTAKMPAPKLATGEIAAIGQKSPAIVVHDWLHSAGHCKVMSDAQLTHMGSGSVINPQADGTIYGSPAWVVNFGQYY